MRRWRSHHPQGPRTASRFDAMAARIFRMQTKKNRAKITLTTPRNGAGIDRMIQPWKRYQKTPVTWKEPRSLQDHPRSGAWGGLASAGAVTGRFGTRLGADSTMTPPRSRPADPSGRGRPSDRWTVSTDQVAARGPPGSRRSAPNGGRRS